MPSPVKRTEGTEAKNHHSQAGQATVELALSLALLLLFLIAALDFGRAFFGYVAITNAAREGARSAVFSWTPSTIESAVRQEIIGNGLDPSRLTVQYTWGGSGQAVVVNVRYRFNLIVASFLPVSQLILQASATMLLP